MIIFMSAATGLYFKINLSCTEVQSVASQHHPCRQVILVAVLIENSFYILYNEIQIYYLHLHFSNYIIQQLKHLM
jgi:hypothetical protein